MLEYFLDPYPDELLYSVWARFSEQVRYPNRNDVSQELFGNRSCQALVDWSCSLGYLVSQLPTGHRYTEDMLIDGHTLFPVYAPFLSPERRQLLRDQMINGNGRALSARLGMMTSHIPRHEWLRYCPACVTSDRDRYGETYWHRLHQAPGVEVCPIHATFLEDSTAARQPRNRGFTSAKRTIQPVLPRLAINSPLYDLFRGVAECMDQLLRRAHTSPGQSFLRKQYFILLEQHGFVTIKGSLRVVEFLKGLTDYYPPSFLSLLNCELTHTRHIEAEWPARLPFARRPQHPLHHILVIRFLGTPLEAFLGSPFRPLRPFGDGPWPCLNPICEQYRMPCIMVYSIREKSLKGHPVGLFACAYCGFTYSRVGPDQSPQDMFRRGKIPSYGHLWQMKLHDLWLDPDISTERIAHHLGVDFNTVKQQAKRLALPPRLVLRKGSVKIQSERQKLEQRRKEWLRLIELHAQDGITALIRRIKGARSTYNWLNKHDREWLLSHRPPKKVSQKTKVHLQTTFRSVRENPNKSRKEEHDAITAQSIKVMAQKVMNSTGEPRRVTRNQLERVAPSLGWLLSRPTDYPLTARAFQGVRETREAFALRRVQWALQRYREECTLPVRKEFISRAKVKKVLDIPSVLVAIEAALTTLARK